MAGSGQSQIAGKAAEVVERLGRIILSEDFGNTEWHRTNFAAHCSRYQHDLATVMGLAMPAFPLLELGSAPGHFTAALRLAGYQVSGVDLEPTRIRAFCGRFDLTIAACDIEREPLPYPDGSFALAVLAETYEHLRWDPFFALSEIHRVLKPGGLLLLTTPNLYSAQNIARFLTGRSIADPIVEFGKLRRVGHMGHVREYSARQMRQILAAHGFSVTRHTFHDYSNTSTRRNRIKRVAFMVLPSQFRTFQAIVASTVQGGIRLDPLPEMARTQ